AGPTAGPTKGLMSSLMGPGEPEFWAWGAFLLGPAVVLGWGYLLARPGGTGPVWFYGIGRYLAVVVALFLGFVGLVFAWRRQPFLARRRGLAFAILALVIGAAPFPVPYPSSREFRPSSVGFHLPAKGEWRVVWGGTGQSGPLALLADRRWGLVLVREDSAEDPPEGPSWGQAVLAPAAGTIVAAEDGHVDCAPGQAPSGPRAGNHVVLQVAEEEFVVLAFLRQGSLTVSVGQSVERGELLGEVGLSGSGPLLGVPHLALHLQTLPEPFQGEAIPWTFKEYAADGVELRSGLPVGGVSLDGTLNGQLVRSLGGD
ncbi:MAG: hypothetical protein ACI9HE_003948, partial [Planctomycetota bacterium]